MSFRKYGGIGFAATNNIVRSHYSNSDNVTISNSIGQPNSKIISQCHIDMSGNALMNTGQIIFMDGSVQTTAYLNQSNAITDIKNGLNVSGNMSFNGNVIVDGTLSVSKATTLYSGLTVSSGLTLSSGDLTISTGSLNVNNKLTVSSTGITTINNTKTSDLLLSKSVGFDGAFIVKGGVGIEGTMNVGGKVKIQELLTMEKNHIFLHKDVPISGTLLSRDIPAIIFSDNTYLDTADGCWLKSVNTTNNGIYNPNYIKNGYVGIGTDNPLSALHVAGVFRIDNNYTDKSQTFGVDISGNTTIGGTSISYSPLKSPEDTISLFTSSSKINIGKDSGNDVNATGTVTIMSTKKAPTAATGALVVKGGIGVSQDSYFGIGAQVMIANITPATISENSGALVVKGGIKVSQNSYFGDNAQVFVTNSAPATISENSGALVVKGGIKVSQNSYFDPSAKVTILNPVPATDQSDIGALVVKGGIKVYQNSYFDPSAQVFIKNPTAATNTTGALDVSGGILTRSNIYVGSPDAFVDASKNALYVAGGIGLNGNYLVSSLQPDLSFNLLTKSSNINIGTSDVTASVIINSTQPATIAANIGALVVKGGIKVYQNSYFDPSAQVFIKNPTAATNTTGALDVSGGILTRSNIYVGSTASSADASTNALYVAGGIGLNGNYLVSSLQSDLSFNLLTKSSNINIGMSLANASVIINSTQPATIAATSGALVVKGGIKVYQTSYFDPSAQVFISNITPATSGSDIGALVVKGGIKVSQNSYFDTDAKVTIANNTQAISTTGALDVSGGILTRSNIYVGSTLSNETANANALYVAGGIGLNGNYLVSSSSPDLSFNLLTKSSNINIGSSTASVIINSTQTTSGTTTSNGNFALNVKGGVNIDKDLNVNGDAHFNTVTINSNLILNKDVPFVVAGDLTVNGFLNYKNLAFTGDFKVLGGKILTDVSYSSIFDTIATQISIGAAASKINMGGDLKLTSGNLTTDSSIASIFDASATQISIGKAANQISIGKAATKISIGSDASGIKMDSSSNTTTFNNNIIVNGDLNVTGTSTLANFTLDKLNLSTDIITTASSTASIFDASATQISIGAAASKINMGGKINITSGNLTTDSPNVSIFDASASQISIGAAASKINMGGNLKLTSGIITTDSSIASIFDASATQISIGKAATQINMGSEGGLMTINNDLTVRGKFSQVTFSDDSLFLTSTPALDYSQFGNRFNNPNNISSTLKNVAISATGQYQTIIDNSFVYVSTKYGLDRKEKNPNSAYKWSDVAISASGLYLVVVRNSSDSSGNIYNSSDSGTTWIQDSSNIISNCIAVAISADGKYKTIVTPYSVFTTELSTNKLIPTCNITYNTTSTLTQYIALTAQKTAADIISTAAITDISNNAAIYGYNDGSFNRLFKAVNDASTFQDKYTKINDLERYILEVRCGLIIDEDTDEDTETNNHHITTDPSFNAFIDSIEAAEHAVETSRDLDTSLNAIPNNNNNLITYIKANPNLIADISNSIQSVTSNDISFSCISISSTSQYQTACTNTANGQIYYSSNYGVTWNSNKDISGNWSSVAVSATGKFQTAVQNSTTGNIYYSSNYGSSWTPAKESGYSTNVIGSWSSVSMISSGCYQIATQNLSTLSYIYISSDYGNTWTQQSQNGNFISSAVSSNGQYQMVCTSSLLFLSVTPYPNSYFSGTLDVSGTQTNIALINANGGINVNKNFNVDSNGNIDASGNLNINKKFNVDSNGNIDMSGNLNINKNFNVDVSGNIDASGNLNINKKFNVDVSGNLNINKKFNVDSNGNIDMSGNLNINKKFNVDSNGNIDASGVFKSYVKNNPPFIVDPTALLHPVANLSIGGNAATANKVNNAITFNSANSYNGSSPVNIIFPTKGSGFEFSDLKVTTELSVGYNTNSGMFDPNDNEIIYYTKTFVVSNTGNVTANSFNAISDYRVKKNVQPLDSTLFNVDKLIPVTYNKIDSGKQDIGFIAHEVQEVFPFLVTGEKDGEQTQSLNYLGLIGVLVKEIQELKKRVAVLENR